MPKKKEKEKQTLPPQHQDRQPGIEAEMKPRHSAEDREYRGSGKIDVFARGLNDLLAGNANSHVVIPAKAGT